MVRSFMFPRKSKRRKQVKDVGDEEAREETNNDIE
jgi:hypothetical protein